MEAAKFDHSSLRRTALGKEIRALPVTVRGCWKRLMQPISCRLVEACLARLAEGPASVGVAAGEETE